jgi:hypothetical protein
MRGLLCCGLDFGRDHPLLTKQGSGERRRIRIYDAAHPLPFLGVR